MHRLLVGICCVVAAYAAKVTHELDLSSSIVRGTTTIESDATTLVVALPNADQIASISAWQDDDDVALEKVAQPGFKLAPGQVAYKVQKRADAALTIETASCDTLTPLPAQVTLTEQQLLVYNGDLYGVTIDQPMEYSLSVSVPGPVESFTDGGEEETDGSAKVIKYGPFQDVEPAASAPLRVHYVNNAPCVRADKLVRTFQVSHWGTLQVEETYYISHFGPKLKGPFSRLDYQRMGSPSAVPAVTAVLPGTAADIYFRDAIGNISSSTINESDEQSDKIEVVFQQRFPLLGGWKTDFYMGYTLGLEEVMNTTDSGNVRLQVPFASPMKNLHVVELETQIILPEGVSGVKLTLDGQTVEYSEGVKQTVLDTAGRPTYTLRHNNIVSPDDERQIQVEYTFSTMAMMREPLMLTFGILGLFVMTIVLQWVI